MQIDPNVWYFNPETGEYHLITGRHKGQIFFDQKTYAQRFAEDYAAAKERRQVYICLPVLGLISLLGYVGFRQDGPIAVIGVFILGLGALLFVATCFMALAVFIRSRKDTVGPPPVPPPGREQVEAQKVHGEGRVMTREEMDRALRGSAPSAQPQTFKD